MRATVISGSPMIAVGSDELMDCNNMGPAISDLNAPAQSMGTSRATYLRASASVRLRNSTSVVTVSVWRNPEVFQISATLLRKLTFLPLN